MTSEQVFWIFGIGFVFGLLAGALGAWLLSLFRAQKRKDNLDRIALETILDRLSKDVLTEDEMNGLLNIGLQMGVISKEPRP